MSDKIFISDLAVRCVIGINDWERNVLQDVMINLEIDTDLRPAGESDRVTDTLDYKALNKSIMKMAEHSEFFLVEALAKRIAAMVLEDDRATAVTVKVEKPGALRFARSVGVQIRRTRDGAGE